LGAQPDELADVIKAGQLAGKHSEFSEIARLLGLERSHCIHVFTGVVAQSNSDDFAALVKRVEDIL
jgi:hypothetical protein